MLKICIQQMILSIKGKKGEDYDRIIWKPRLGLGGSPNSKMSTEERRAEL
jgi:hypothetical protein